MTPKIQRIKPLFKSETNAWLCSNVISCDPPSSHVISFLRHWLESYPQDFHSPPAHPLLAKLHPLTISHPLLQRIVDNLLLDFETRDFVKRGRSGVSVDSGLGVLIEDSDPVDECDGSEDFDLGTLNPQQFAQCLTALDAVSRICM